MEEDNIQYFSNYFLHRSDVTFDLNENEMEVHEKFSEPWKVTLVDTGQDTMTGGRLKRVAKYIEKEDSFCMTYGDGLTDLNIEDLIKFHQGHGLQATLTSTITPSRFGLIESKKGIVKSFKEKPAEELNKINGGFFVLSPKVLSLLKDDKTIWEQEPLERLASDGQLASFEHEGFWHPMDTLRDKNVLESLWDSGSAPWKKW